MLWEAGGTLSACAPLWEAGGTLSACAPLWEAGDCEAESGASCAWEAGGTLSASAPLWDADAPASGWGEALLTGALTGASEAEKPAATQTVRQRVAISAAATATVRRRLGAAGCSRAARRAFISFFGPPRPAAPAGRGRLWAASSSRRL